MTGSGSIGPFTRPSSTRDAAQLRSESPDATARYEQLRGKIQGITADLDPLVGPVTPEELRDYARARASAQPSEADDDDEDDN